jgi:hypothetical protein
MTIRQFPEPAVEEERDALPGFRLVEAALMVPPLLVIAPQLPMLEPLPMFKAPLAVNEPPPATVSQALEVATMAPLTLTTPLLPMKSFAPVVALFSAVLARVNAPLLNPFVLTVKVPALIMDPKLAATIGLT